MEYKEDDFLQLSGIQHFKFCRRQWSLIHIEQQWLENYCTTDGTLLHEKAHDSSLSESRGDTIIVHGMSVFSPTLGVSGQCDVVEFHRTDNGISMKGKQGLWLPFPVEYKRSFGTGQTADLLQLCAQAMCLEEMLCCDIPKGALFSWETRRRLPVNFSSELRMEVTALLFEMHEMFNKAYTPIVKPSKVCNACSLKELCLPKLMKKHNVQGYLFGSMEESL